ncbi:MAG: copper ion binding protein [Actinomycetota bacterium]|nr:copper ion binding protein [Actinomycetota bacterium]
MTTQTLSVPEIHCDHCKTSIEGAVGRLAGVEDVKVDVGGHSVRLTFDEGRVSQQAIIEAIEEQGYQVAG